MRRARLNLLALAAALLLPAAPAPAQADSSAPPAIPADTLVPNENARAVFEELARQPITVETITARIGPVGSPEGQPMDAVIEQTLVRGERVPDWQALGADLYAIVAAREGGLAGNMTFSESEFGPSYLYFVDRPLDAFIPAEWVLVGRHGAPVAGENVQVVIARISPKVIAAARAVNRRQGNAYCLERAESRLYADPTVSASEFDTVTVMMTMRFLATPMTASFCVVASAEADGLYRSRNFDAEGHPLQALDAGSAPFRIVPFALPAR